MSTCILADRALSRRVSLALPFPSFVASEAVLAGEVIAEGVAPALFLPLFLLPPFVIGDVIIFTVPASRRSVQIMPRLAFVSVKTVIAGHLCPGRQIPFGSQT